MSISTTLRKEREISDSKWDGVMDIHTWGCVKGKKDMAVTLNETPSSNRLHIGIFGKTNSGKSAFINAFTGRKSPSWQMWQERPQTRYTRRWRSIP